MFLIITYQDSAPLEVFITIGKAGTCERAWAEALGRTISIGLRNGVPVAEYIDQLQDISCLPVAFDGGFIHSPADGIAKTLKRLFSGG